MWIYGHQWAWRPLLLALPQGSADLVWGGSPGADVGGAGFGAAVLPTSSDCTPAQTHSRTHMRTRSHSISHAHVLTLDLAHTQMARVTRARDNRTCTSHAWHTWHTNTHAHAHVHARVCTNAHAPTHARTHICEHARTHARALDGCSFVRSASTARTTSS